MPRSGSPRQIPPAVREAADRLSARRSILGAASYPFVLLILGWPADLHRKTPLLFTGAAFAVLALAASRDYLARRFDAIFHASPRRWRIAFYAVLIAKALLLGWLFFGVITSLGP
jgi:hypothetical protein